MIMHRNSIANTTMTQVGCKLQAVAKGYEGSATAASSEAQQRPGEEEEELSRVC